MAGYLWLGATQAPTDTCRLWRSRIPARARALLLGGGAAAADRQVEGFILPISFVCGSMTCLEEEGREGAETRGGFLSLGLASGALGGSMQVRWCMHAIRAHIGGTIGAYFFLGSRSVLFYVTVCRHTDWNVGASTDSGRPAAALGPRAVLYESAGCETGKSRE
jgi:hypothetical protein